MKTLVLSCDTGQGHNMAANAVCEALNASEPSMKCSTRLPPSAPIKRLTA